MNQIIITKGSGGYGGSLVIKPTDKKNKVMYITGGNEPAILKRIVELTGLIPVNGFKTKVPDEEIAVAIVDCGGVVRCGVYPQKGIPTVNTRNTGKAGPFAKFITPKYCLWSYKRSSDTAIGGVSAYGFQSKYEGEGSWFRCYRLCKRKYDTFLWRYGTGRSSVNTALF